MSFYTDWHLPMDDPQLVDFLSFDQQKSRDLIAAMRADGVNVDRKMRWLFSASSQFQADAAVLGTQMLKEVGIDVRGEAYPGSEISSRVLRRATADFDFTLTESGPPEPRQQLRTLHTDSKYVVEAMCLCDPEYDAMVEDWELTTDAEEIASKAIAIQRWLIEHWPPVWFWYMGFTRTLFSTSLRNINPFEGESDQYSWIDESYLPG